MTSERAVPAAERSIANMIDQAVVRYRETVAIDPADTESIWSNVEMGLALAALAAAEARIAELEQRTEAALSAADESATGMVRYWVRLQRAEATIARVEALCNVTLSGGEQWPIIDSKTVKVGDIRAALAGSAVPVPAEEPGEAVFSHEIPPIAPGRRPAPHLNPNWPYEYRPVKACRGCGRQTLTFHVEGCGVASYEVVLDADCAPVAAADKETDR